MLVTVVTVVKNNKNFIARTLESVLQQKYKNIELIVVDGKSDDGTYKIIYDYFKEFKLISRKDKSVYDSLNYACKIAKGDFLCFLHSGDVYYNDKVISTFVKNVNGIDLISSNILYFNDNLNITRLWRAPNDTFNQYNSHKFSHTGMFYSKKIYKKFLYDENFKISSDSKFLSKIGTKKIKHKSINFYSVCMFNKGLSTEMSSLTQRVKEDLDYLIDYHKYKFLYYYFLKITHKIPSFINFASNINKIEKKMFYTFKKIEKSCLRKKIYQMEYYFFFKKIKLIKNINKFINNKNNFVLSALNLAFLGSLYSKKIIIYKDLYHWPDGYLPLMISRSYKNINKVAGRNLVRNIKLNNKIKEVHVLGNLNKDQKKFLRILLKKTVRHTQLPFGSPSFIASKCPKLKKNVIYFLTIPTPKQEQVSEILSIKNKNFKLVLLGGAINILTGVEKEVPKKLAYIEFLWRLRFETLKRLRRLISTTISFIFHSIFEKKYNNILK